MAYQQQLMKPTSYCVQGNLIQLCLANIIEPEKIKEKNKEGHIIAITTTYIEIDNYFDYFFNTNLETRIRIMESLPTKEFRSDFYEIIIKSRIDYLTHEKTVYDINYNLKENQLFLNCIVNDDENYSCFNSEYSNNEKELKFKSYLQ